MFGSFRNWIRLLLRNRVEPRHAVKALVYLVGSLLTAPLRVRERLRFRSTIEKTRLDAPPIFILGHWRCGTTYLQELMANDPALGFMSMFQGTAPEFFLSGGFLKGVLDKAISGKRPMDNMTVAIDSPWEEEMAVAGMTEYSFCHYLYFPRSTVDLFRRNVLFEDPRARAAWSKAYVEVLKKATISMGGKRLVLKNPPNTARIPLLLELFPGAKFVHITRDPHVVFASRKHELRSTTALFGLQTVSDAEIESDALTLFTALMSRYDEDKGKIPAGNLVELRFEDLEADPLGEMRTLYAALGLPGFAAAEPGFRAYLAARTSYVKNVFSPTVEDRAKVERHWGRWVRAWGYGDAPLPNSFSPAMPAAATSATTNQV